MTQSKILRTAATVVTFSMLAAGCISSSSHGSDPSGWPVRATIRVGLETDRFYDNSVMAKYANDVAKAVEAKFLLPGLWSSDTLVTAVPPDCFGSRTGCRPVAFWTLAIHSEYMMSGDAATVALGNGQLTAREDFGLVPVGPECPADPLGPGASQIPITAPFVPSTSNQGCVSLGPVLRTITGAAATPNGVPGASSPSFLPISLTSPDTQWVQGWGRANAGHILALLLDGRVIALEESAYAGRNIPNASLTIPSITIPAMVGQAMAKAIDDGPFLPFLKAVNASG